MWSFFSILQKNADLREGDMKGRSQRLDEMLRSTMENRASIHWIASKTSNGLGDLAFFVIGAGPESSNGLERLLEDYAQAHGLHIGPARAVQ
jgi:hypothetical protein